MPIYEYECRKCNDVFESLLGPGDEPPLSISCPYDNCSGVADKVMSATSGLTGKGGRERGFGPSQLEDETITVPAARLCTDCGGISDFGFLKIPVQSDRKKKMH